MIRHPVTSVPVIGRRLTSPHIRALIHLSGVPWPIEPEVGVGPTRSALRGRRSPTGASLACGALVRGYQAADKTPGGFSDPADIATTSINLDAAHEVSTSVSRGGVEPPAPSMSGWCSTAELPEQVVSHRS